MRRLAALLIVACLGGRAVAAAPDDATIAFNFQDVELAVLARFVSEVTGRSFIVDDRVRGKVTVISPTRVAPDEAYLAFQSVLRVKGFSTIESGAFTKIVPAADARESGTARGDPGGEATVTRILPLVHADAAELVPVLQPLVSKDGLLTAHSPRNTLLVVDAAANVDRLARLVAELDHPPRPGATRIHVVRLRYAEAAGLVRVLAQLVGLPPPPPPPTAPHGSSFMRRATAERLHDDFTAAPAATATGTGDPGALPLESPVRLTADPATNALIVSATPRDWAVLRPVVEALDVRRRQVFVEAIIVEASVERSRALGVEFQTATDTGGHGVLTQGNLAVLAGAAADPLSVPGLLLAAASNETVTLPDGRVVPAHRALLSALETDAELNVLSAPNIVTTDNEEAEIVVGRNVPFVTGRSTTITDPQNLFTTIERHDVGITLRMRPQITADDFVRLTLFEEVSDIDPETVVGNPSLVGPTTTIRAASTSVAARDGQTVVIGGLLADSVRSVERRVPYLGRIPVLGALFRRTDDRRTKTNLLVFLTPHIIASDRQMAESSLRQRERMPRALRESPALGGPGWQAP